MCSTGWALCFDQAGFVVNADAHALEVVVPVSDDRVRQLMQSWQSIAFGAAFPVKLVNHLHTTDAANPHREHWRIVGDISFRWYPRSQTLRVEFDYVQRWYAADWNELSFPRKRSIGRARKRKAAREQDLLL